ncbi:upf0585 protein c16orf13-like protein [Plakobranchus ocellatus]|uniref:Upf0585 protein c16orf13-like protein n=1 Tax=Plakobranchus ocellatus TaxID=259542 RepID=A0AAV4BMQ1_9GAST|nr:upf0585 protein c16orf13-like protein [Plakobranchus ocellatus]
MSIAGAAERNKQPILDVLTKYIPLKSSFVLEIASGTGQHICHFAPKFPDTRWQPSDMDSASLKSIQAHIENKDLKNVLPPLQVDITKPIAQWASPDVTPGSCDLVLNVNMVHISPWEAAVGLFKTAGTLLKPGGYLFMYGPFKVNGILVPDSNVQFDQHLRSRDSRWGIRDIADLDKLAEENNLKRENMVDMPANNKCTIYKKN